MTSILLTIETDAKEALKWVEGEVAAGLTAVGQLVLPIVNAAEPGLVAAVKSAAETFLASLRRVGSIDDLEQDFIEFLEFTGSTLVKDVEALEGPILQAIIALVKAAP
jgi:hypothetical protein